VSQKGWSSLQLTQLLLFFSTPINIFYSIHGADYGMLIGNWKKQKIFGGVLCKDNMKRFSNP
jgi:hypothetical protein